MADYLFPDTMRIYSDVPNYFKSLSLRLYQVMEDIGATTEMRQTMIDNNTTMEILNTLITEPARTCHVFGSSYEGTATRNMNSDSDMVTVLNYLPVVTDCSEFSTGTCLLYIQDHKTPAGYCKLQLLQTGAPMNSQLTTSLSDETLFIANLYQNYITFSADKYNKILCSYSPSIYLQRFYKSRHGPALSTEQMHDTMATDTIIAVNSDKIPDCVSEWFTRRRPFNFPTPGMLESCKRFGSLYVPIGHPRSDEQHLEWRISLSHQERFLVGQFNSVQLKCYILLKLIKLEFVEPYIKDGLSSYHLKTCMLYIIENTPSEFWNPENLVTCIGACLKLISLWADTGICPNYFISAENMFDRHVYGEVRMHLYQVLENLLSAEHKYLLWIKIEKVGQRLQNLFVPLPLQSPEDRFTFLRNEMYVSKELRGRKLFYALSPVTDCLQYRLYHLIGCDSVQPWLSLSRLREIKTISDRTEEETQRAIKLILPYVELGFLSNLIARAANSGCIKDQICACLISKKWQEISSASDALSSKLKQACLLYIHGYFHLAVDILSSLMHLNRLSVCSCYFEGRHVFPHIHEVVDMAEGVSEISTESILKNVYAPCVFFMPSERAVIPTAICIEMGRNVASPLFTGRITQSYHDWAFVDGQFLLHFLLYLNHKKLDMCDNAETDIENMVLVINTKLIGHADACLNLLGWVYKDCGQFDKAAECFKRSMDIRSGGNAAYWHMCIMVFELLGNKMRAV